MVQGPRSVQLTDGGRPPRRILLARHGRTGWNRQGRYQGHGDPPLDETGWQQAADLADRRVPLDPAGLASSDRLRARQTAGAVGAATGLEVRVDPAFREVDLGTWEGLTEAEVADRHPGELRAWLAGDDVRRGGGETLTEAADRFVGGLDRLPAADDPGPWVVVAHGLVVRRALERLASAGRIDLAGDAPHLGNGQWAEIALAPET